MEENTQTQNDQSSQSTVSEKPRRDYFLPVSILVAGILIAGSVVYLVASLHKTSPGVGTVPGESNGPAPQVGARDVILGDAKASVSVIEYGDYQCPFCVRFFEESEPQIRETYVKVGKVKMVFRNFQFLGPESTAAAEAAECAKDQNQFWAFHDALYKAEGIDGKEGNGNLNRQLFLKLADQLKLDTKAFTSCIDSNKYADQVKADTKDAQSAGVNSTPTVFVNDKKFLGALPFDQFKDAIEEAFKAK